MMRIPCATFSTNGIRVLGGVEIQLPWAKPRTGGEVGFRRLERDRVASRREAQVEVNIVEVEIEVNELVLVIVVIVKLKLISICNNAI